MSDNNNNAKTMYEAVPAAAELNKVPGFDPLKFLRRAGDSMKLDLPYQKLWFRMAHPNGRMRLTAMRITEQMAIFEAKVFPVSYTHLLPDQSDLNTHPSL